MRYLPILLVLLTTSVQAQDYTISADKHKELLTYLGEVPAKFANPVINELIRLQTEAKEKAEKAVKPQEKK